MKVGWEEEPRTRKALERELWARRGDVRRLEEEISALRGRVSGLVTELTSEREGRRMNKRKLEDTACSFEVEKRDILSKQDQLLKKIQLLEGTVECMKKRADEMVAENCRWQSKYNSLKEVKRRLEQAREEAERGREAAEKKLCESQNRIRAMENEKLKYLSEISKEKEAVESARQRLNIAEDEATKLKACLERKNSELRKAENDKSKQYESIVELEERASRLNYELVRSRNDDSRRQRETSRLKTDLQTALEENRKLYVETQKLNTCIQSLKKNLELKTIELGKATSDLAKANDRVACLTEKFKSMEEFLEKIERERHEDKRCTSILQEQILNLEMTVKNLQSENCGLGDNLRVAQEKIKNFQVTLKSKDSLICDQDRKIKDLTCLTQQLKTDISKHQQKNMMLKNEVETGKEMIKDLENQRKQYECELKRMSSKIESLNKEIKESKTCIRDLKSELDAEKKRIACLRSAVSESRKERQEESLVNLTVGQKVTELHSRVDKLGKKLSTVNEALAKAEGSCADERNHCEFRLASESYARALACPQTSTRSRSPCRQGPPPRGRFSVTLSSDNGRPSLRPQEDYKMDTSDNTIDCQNSDLFQPTCRRDFGTDDCFPSSSPPQGPSPATSNIITYLKSNNEMNCGKFVSTVEEGPTYHVVKKSYKKVCFTESEEDSNLSSLAKFNIK